jgi:hypothetical protein
MEMTVSQFIRYLESFREKCGDRRVVLAVDDDYHHDIWLDASDDCCVIEPSVPKAHE